MHLLGKGVDDLNVSDSHSFEGCPKAPVTADFQMNTDGTSSFDLDAVRADWAFTLRRTPEVGQP
jgi:hypothetical protein